MTKYELVEALDGAKHLNVATSGSDKVDDNACSTVA
jgi:hypothetical protein